MDTRIAVAVSGGMDSLVALGLALETFPQATVIAHHVAFHNGQRRGEVETLACRECITWMQGNIRPFVYTESRIEFRCCRAPTWAFIAPAIAVVASAHDATHLCDGRRNTPSVTQGPMYPQAFWDWAAPVYRMHNPGYIGYFPVYAMSKAEVLAALPEPLRGNYWSCRSPVAGDDRWLPCGACNPCMEHREMGVSHPVRFRPRSSGVPSSHGGPQP